MPHADKKPKILIIEDDPDQRELLARLRSCGQLLRIGWNGLRLRL